MGQEKPNGSGIDWRWLTPILLTCNLALMGYVINEIRSLRSEIAESRKYSVQYTDRMFDLFTKFVDKKK